MYEYRVLSIPRVIDGDTYDFDLDLGFYAILRIRVRLVGIDTYEIYGRNAHEKGEEARAFAENWMFARLAGRVLGVRTLALTMDTPTADGAFGRWAGVVFDTDTEELLADALRDAGYEDV